MLSVDCFSVAISLKPEGGMLSLKGGRWSMSVKESHWFVPSTSTVGVYCARMRGEGDAHWSMVEAVFHKKMGEEGAH